ncbi:hypothetical protein [Streptomyces minutiscleroticus]|uniref:hypothetical protein n=1 Tax=Streptomyces minutiscleroticus TaxID=68238 RepID=UPI003330E86C
MLIDSLRSTEHVPDSSQSQYFRRGKFSPFGCRGGNIGVGHPALFCDVPGQEFWISVRISGIGAQILYHGCPQLYEFDVLSGIAVV